jgi:hypothetical protein
MHMLDNLVNLVKRMSVLNILSYNTTKIKKRGSRIRRCSLIRTLSAETHTNYTHCAPSGHIETLVF